MNVLGGSPGAPISTCGAEIAQPESAEGLFSGAVSGDGSRVFFTDHCTHQLYMRVNGAETVDIGAYTLLAANAQGTALVLRSGSSGEVEGYDAETGQVVAPSSAVQASEFEISNLRIPVRRAPTTSDLFAYAPSTDFTGFVPGHVFEGVFGLPQGQVYRYDSGEHVVECVSCASTFDPHPAFPAFFQGNEVEPLQNMAFRSLGGSANGDFVFFDTVAALLPQDVDGERAPETNYHFGELYSEEFSPSSDVYEWRRNGLDGCTLVQGCLSLITTGKGGFVNEFLGADASGRDVFFATDESLVPGDQDTASDIYDARIGGGFTGPAPRPAECEGDSCATPAAAPNDLTPASATFLGAGNLTQTQAPSKPKAKPKKQAKKTRKAGSKRRVRKSARVKRAVHRSHGGAK